MSTYYTIMSMIDGFKSFINLAVMVLTIVASWIMYAKAGEHGWAAIVPFYSSYVKFRIAGKQKLFWGYLVASIASIAGCILLMYEIIASGLSVMTSSYMGSYYDSTYGYAGNRIGAHMGMLIFAVILIIAAMIAALYIVLTFIANALGLANYAIQVRFSEALTILPYFTPAAIPGLFAGCLLSNILTGCMPLDVLFGSLATLVGAFGTYALRKHKWLAPLPPIIANIIVVPLVLSYVYQFEGSLPYFALTVGIGEFISCGILGMIVLNTLQKHAGKIFQGIYK